MTSWAARHRIDAAHEVIAHVVAEEQVAYGVTTGFGQLATTHIPTDKVRELQENLVRSHAVGVGVPLSRGVVRAAMTIRLNTMARGHSGVREQVADHLGAMTLEGLRASVGPFQERIQALRPIPGQLESAANVRCATAGSAIMLSH